MTIFHFTNQLTNIFQKSNSNFIRKLSSLAKVMNQRPKLTPSDSLKRANTGLFQIPELKSYEGFAEIKKQCVTEVEKLVEEATSKTRNRKLVDIFDDLSNSLCKAAHVFEFIRIAHPAVSYIQAAGELSGSVDKLVEELNLNSKLYEALKKVVAEGDLEPMNELENRVANLFLLDFTKMGLDLSLFKRQKLAGLNESILVASSEFCAGATSPKFININKVPENVLYAFHRENHQVILSNFQWDSHISDVREASYKLYYKFCPVQEKRLTNLLNLRHTLAQTFGYPSYFEYVLKEDILTTPAQVDEFLKTLSDEIKKVSQYEFDLIQLFKKEYTCSNKKVQAWDLLYYSEEIKCRCLGQQKSDYLPYFSLGVCLEGLSNLYEILHGITLKNVDVKAGETWAPNIYKLAVHHSVDGDLGYIYCDLFARRKKRKPSGLFNLRYGKRLPNGKYQVPIIVVLMNLPLPRTYEPTLIESDCLDKLFHIFGQAVHTILGRSFFQHINDSRNSKTSFFSVLANVMEHFSSDPRILRSFSQHYNLKNPIPEDVLEKFCVKNFLFSGIKMQQRILLSVLDQSFHSKHPLDLTPFEFFKNVAGNYFQGEYVEDTAFYLRRVEFENQGGFVCSKLVCEALAALIFNKYFGKDLDAEEDPEEDFWVNDQLFKGVNKKVFTKSMLDYGKGKSTGDVVKELLNFEVTPRMLAKELGKSVVGKVELVRTFLERNGVKV